MARSFLESTFLTACPSLESAWQAHRRALPPATEPEAEEFLAVLRHHLVGLLAGGRVAEFARVLHTLERLLTESDPILEALLASALARPLVRDLQRAGTLWTQAAPYFGPRTRAAAAPPS